MGPLSNWDLVSKRTSLSLRGVGVSRRRGDRVSHRRDRRRKGPLPVPCRTVVEYRYSGGAWSLLGDGRLVRPVQGEDKGEEQVGIRDCLEGRGPTPSWHSQLPRSGRRGVKADVRASLRRHPRVSPQVSPRVQGRFAVPPESTRPLRRRPRV